RYADDGGRGHAVPRHPAPAARGRHADATPGAAAAAMKLSLKYTPNRSQRPFHASPARYKLLLGAAGSGKTVALCMEDILEAMDYPGSQGVVFRRYYPTLRDTTKKTYLEVCPPELIAREIKSEGREEIEFINRSRTIFRVLDDYKKLGSQAFDRVKI